MKTGLLAIAMLPLREPATVMFPTLMVLGQPQMPLPKRLRQRQSSLPVRFAQVPSPRPMNTGLLAMAIFPFPPPATVMLPTLIRSRQNQSSLAAWFGQLQRPLPMKTGLLAMATLWRPFPWPERATTIFPTAMRLGHPQTPLLKRSRQDQSSWSRSRQNQPSSWVWSDHLQSPLAMNTGLLAMAIF